MKNIIYHGSQTIIEKPIFGYGKDYNDYGLGFYCAEDIDLAKEWAVNFRQSGYANCYEIDLSDLNVLYLNDDKYSILHWLALLLANRRFDVSTGLTYRAKEYLLENFLIDTSGYDIIVGYRADDSYFSFAQDFISGAISYRQLDNAMHLGNLGEQVVLKSEKAFNRLKFKGADFASAEEWYTKKAARDSEARKNDFSSERSNYRKGDLYIHQILEEEMKANDSRLR